MIVPKGPRITRMLAYIGAPLLVLAIWDVAVVIGYQVLGWKWIGIKELPLALYGSVIGLIVGFRNNSAYARWWEARGLWGQVVNNSRSLGRQVVSLMHTNRAAGDNEGDEQALRAAQESLIYHQIAFAHALRQHLRGLDPLEAIAGILAPAEVETLRGADNIPLNIQQRIGNQLREAKDHGWIDALEWQAMDRNVDDLADAQGGCERIKNTPMPKQYDYFPHLFVLLYCIMLPVGMVEPLRWYTPLGSTIVGFMFQALDKIGRDLEDPFDNTIYDVPMTAIATTIERNLRRLLGESKLPPAVVPVQGVLW